MARGGHEHDSIYSFSIYERFPAYTTTREISAI